MIDAYQAASVATQIPTGSPQWAVASAICELRGIPPMLIVGHGPFGHLMNWQAVLAEQLLIAELKCELERKEAAEKP